MNEIKPVVGNGLLSVIHSKDTKLSLKQPFSRDIFLFETHIAGTTHIDDIEMIAPQLNEDDRLNFFREPDNTYDKNAIVIKNNQGKKIGYVPKADNIIFSRLMDAGKLLFGKIIDVEERGSWIHIKIGIYLND